MAEAFSKIWFGQQPVHSWQIFKFKFIWPDSSPIPQAIKINWKQSPGPHEHADIAHHSSKLPLKIGPILSVSVVKRPFLSEAIYPYEFWGTDFTPTLQKSEGFRVKRSPFQDIFRRFIPRSGGVWVWSRSSLLRTLSNAESEVLRLSRRGNNMAKSTPSLEFTSGDIQ